MRAEELNLFVVKSDLLLPPVDTELARMSGLAPLSGTGLRLDELDPHPAQMGFNLRHMGGGS